MSLPFQIEPQKILIERVISVVAAIATAIVKIGACERRIDSVSVESEL